MKLHEYQTKGIFADHGIPVPKGHVAETPEEAERIARELGKPVAVKAQVLVGGRGKAGGIKLAKTPEEARQVAQAILSMTIKGLPVRKVLVEEAADIAQELYLGITNDRKAKRPVVMASSEGGVDIEEVARRSPEKIARTHIDPLLGLQAYQLRNLALAIGLPREHWRAFIAFGQALARVYQKYDATLVEINPLVVTQDGRMIALDAKMVVDDNALFRHPDLEQMRDIEAEDPVEMEARKYGLSYIKLEGNIGCMVNGAGLAMATMDIIKLFGGEPANFLDIGGGASAEKVAHAMRLILSDPNVKAVLINIFGGITRGDEVAKGILKAMEMVKPEVPMVVRLVGTRAEEGLKLLAEAQMETASTLTEAAQKAVALASGG